MTASWFDDFTDYLATGGIGTVGTTLFQCQFDLDTREGVCVNPSGGQLNHSSLPSKPRIQVMTRYKSGAASFAKSSAVRTLLNRTGNVTQGANRFLFFRPIHEPMSIGKDGLGMTRFVTTYELHIV